MAQQQSYLPEVVPLPLPDDVLTDIVEKSKDWCLMHGAAMRPKSNYSEDSITFAPFTLLPSPFPRREFAKAVRIQTILNELVHRCANDRAFLTECLHDAIQVDEFTGGLFKIYETVQTEGVAQPLSLGMLRSDLMLETLCRQDNSSDEDLNEERLRPYCCWKQVEMNTIASGFGFLGPVSSRIHRYVLQELGHSDKLANLPENNALQGLCGGMIEAWKIYGKLEAVILFVVEDVTYNICDQRFHEFEIRHMNPEVKVIRRTLTQIAAKGSLSSENELIVDGHVVAVVYFRAGYEPGHYHGKKEWDARLMIERSLAIKCPSIHYHLAGTKKVQQALAKPGALEQFVSDPKSIEALKEIFTGLYSLDFDETGERALQMALNDPEKYVLKPQREGGGNNVYGSEIRTALLKMKNSKERAAWILMDRIRPPITKGYLVRAGGPNPPPVSEMVSELGIFGVVIGDSQKILVNRQVGHMLRTKMSDANEGGVAAGSGALDSPYLVD
ncbi:glutathione synthetase-like isoform X1 [Aethina tumida]|uniref:glutathione synthetase-like isoform X1 n=1 Tax=Aethina tumida TaxID=116153 RepID=UPI0021491D08|nr:glutathione synthetase-like isoform X1 [Aethina tumida]